jgi:MinD-like ATPase involved in chromosome partitioning or flagellar assembly
MATAILLDFGSGLPVYLKPLLDLTDRLVIVGEPLYPSNRFALALVDELESSGYGRHKMSVVLVTKSRTSLQIPWRQVQADLGVELAGIFPPAAEQSHQAAQTGTPLVMMEQNSLLTDQIQQMAENLANYLQPVRG